MTRLMILAVTLLILAIWPGRPVVSFYFPYVARYWGW